MSSQPPFPPAVVLPGESPVHEAFGDRATFLLTGEQTGGQFTMFILETPPGGGPPPHRHDDEDEWFLVLEGRAEFLRDGEWSEVPVGTAVFMPKGSVHAFRNPGEVPLKQVIHTAPAGFETFFGRCAAEFVQEGGPDMGKIVAISAEHGIHYV